MARILIIFCFLLLKFSTASIAGSSAMSMPVSKSFLVTSVSPGDDDLKKIIQRPRYFKSGKHDNGQVKKKKLKIRYMKSEVRLPLLSFQEFHEPSFFTEGKLAFYYSSNLNTQYHKHYQLRGPPSFRFS